MHTAPHVSYNPKTDNRWETYGTAYNPKTDNRWETYGTAYNPKTDNRGAIYKVCCACMHVYNKHTCKNRTDAVWAMRQGGTKAIWVVCFESLNKTFLAVCKCGSMLQTSSVAVYHVQYRAQSVTTANEIPGL